MAIQALNCHTTSADFQSLTLSVYADALRAQIKWIIYRI